MGQVGLFTEYLRKPNILESKGRVRRNISDGFSEDDDDEDDEEDEDEDGDEDEESDYTKYFPESEGKQNIKLEHLIFCLISSFSPFFNIPIPDSYQ